MMVPMTIQKHVLSPTETASYIEEFLMAVQEELVI
jgi:hypothetical protein